jgi:hypothetical protein
MFFAEFSLTVSTFKAMLTKENKLYYALSGCESPDGQEFSGSCEESCFPLGRPRLRIANLLCMAL